MALHHAQWIRSSLTAQFYGFYKMGCFVDGASFRYTEETMWTHTKKNIDIYIRMHISSSGH